jgi:NAD+ synthase
MKSSNEMKRTQIALALGVKDLSGPGKLNDEIRSRIDFIKERVLASGVKALVLGISGGVDSTTAGRLCQVAVLELRAEGFDVKFIAIRLPYQVQRDESDAQAALNFIGADEVRTVNIGASVDGMMNALAFDTEPAKLDFVKGNVKARARMIAQYGIANLENGLVVGTDHGAECVMAFYTKFGDGSCDIVPLSGLVKGQVRQIAEQLGAPEFLVRKTPTADLEDLDPGKPDEVAYGCTYDDIDNFLLGKDVSDEIAERIIGVYERTGHKREMPYAPQ